jgi:hypothetical protein
MTTTTLGTIVARLEDASEGPTGWIGKCPAHEDNHPSLSVRLGDDGRILLKCFAGCSAEAIASRLGLTLRDLFPSRHAHVSRLPDKGKRIVETYPYADEFGDVLYEVVRYDPKDFRLRRPDGNGDWVWAVKDLRRVLYRLSEVLKAKAECRPIIVVEGEKDCDSLIAAGLTATTIAGGAQGPLPSDIGDQLAGATVVIIPDNDDAGRTFAKRIAKSIVARISSLKIVDLPGLPEKGDVSDWLAGGGQITKLEALIAATPGYSSDKQGRSNDTSAKLRRAESTFEGQLDEPWPEAVEGSSLLNAIVSVLRRFVVMPREAAAAISLWILHTYAADVADFTPYILITSPVRECGKTTLIDVLEALVKNPRRSDGITAAALYRIIDNSSPTILLDELDTRLAGEGGESLRGVLNSGFKPSGRMTICVGERHEARDFKTYCPKVLAGIGKPWDTVMSRSIPVRLARATHEERRRLQKIIGSKIHNDLSVLRRQCLRWVQDASERLSNDRDPLVPESLSARQADIWRPLLTIADVAAGRWPNRARVSAKTLHDSSDEDGDIGAQLLIDLRSLYLERTAEKLKSSEIIAHLLTLEERPWAEMPGSGRPLSAVRLAALLRRFGVRPRNLRDGDAVRKGYHLDDLITVFNRYLSAQLEFSPTTSRSAATAATRPNSIDLFRDEPPVAAVAAKSGGWPLDAERQYLEDERAGMMAS